MSQAGAVIVGAGSSQRLGADKVFLPLAGKPLLAWPVDVCQSCELLSQIVIVLNESNLDSGRNLVAERGWSKVVGVCLGGERRQDSVRQGLKELKRCDWVVIHDGARPFLTLDLIRDGLEAARGTGAATAAVPVKDTIKLGDDNEMVRETLHRQRLWAVQTPQVFRFDIITRAHGQVTDEVTDDATLAERLGYEVKLYMGSYHNIKITTPEDLALAEIAVKDR
ncbi:MAG: 2-C-methyl-D-erythritol 4-phosphate cytidylyltransferase [Dehalococcoidia bacterium]|nr:2-C-methyl-D-erythritol 4-phosphate cytidylyltransferase [Dehalococcoidia bacterium]